ncbi:MAG: ribonuclease HIII [bacterium]|nr:ribonuclease HIII [bacterium]
MPEDELLRGGYIGSDESGKGDYFGPLVVAAVAAETDGQDLLRKWGVRDSKKLSDKRINELSALIRGHLPYELISINPEKYNELYEKLNNLNRLLAWAHARAIENLGQKRHDIDVVVVDKFGPERRLQNALMGRGREMRIFQETGAERYPAVAAASIIARAEFTRRLSALSERIGKTLPRGATHVLDTAKEIYNTRGAELLSQVAKVHFKTTDEVLRLF